MILMFAEKMIVMYSAILWLNVDSFLMYPIRASIYRQKKSATTENRRPFLFQPDKTEVANMLDYDNVVFQPAVQSDLNSVAIWMARERMQVAAWATDISCMMSPAFSMVTLHNCKYDYMHVVSIRLCMTRLQVCIAMLQLTIPSSYGVCKKVGMYVNVYVRKLMYVQM